MASSIDPSDYEESATHGGQGDMLAALDRYLAGKDPKGTRERKAKSSHTRGMLGVLQQAPTVLLLKEALRRAQEVVAREQAAERQRRHRDKVRREGQSARN